MQQSGTRNISEALIGIEMEPPSGVVSTFLIGKDHNRTARNLLLFARDIGTSRQGMTLPL
jgi:hypothetical protein